MKLNKRPVTKRQAKAAAKVSKAKALRTSELKWEAAVFELLNDSNAIPDASANTCSLCHRYNTVDQTGVVTGFCDACPLYKISSSPRYPKYGCVTGSYPNYVDNKTPENALAVLNDIRSLSKKAPLKLADFDTDL